MFSILAVVRLVHFRIIVLIRSCQGRYDNESEKWDHPLCLGLESILALMIAFFQSH
jgi:hypothetical protein